MGTMNLLQGGIKGSVGAHTGVRKHGKNIFKAKIWSKEPPSINQKNNVRSFEALNRISSAIAKTFWEWMGYTQGNMYKHNVIASHFKPIIRSHAFVPLALKDVIPTSDKIDVQDFSIDAVNGEIILSVSANIPGININTQAVLLLICNSIGKVMYCEKMATPILNITFKAPITAFFPYYLIAFSSTKDGTERKLDDLVVKMTLPENVFYTENYPNIRWWTVNPNYLYGEGGGISTSGVTLVVDGSIG